VILLIHNHGNWKVSTSKDFSSRSLREREMRTVLCNLQRQTVCVVVDGLGLDDAAYVRGSMHATTHQQRRGQCARVDAARDMDEWEAPRV
jgi:hypothetical protein